ncbi:tripartite ATP-independent periplasmic transporter, DctQ component (plasmid) [Antarctobacter heliothermus]|uniref:TRAP transporter small permease protein n=1 Tax=Antarctobacter heliothermus TaxID=74033 RepID=A0A222EAZ6_9RHOB|nr:TRAP transporter small permease [Antarctobacter heliothermus]ASP23238.1 tripartite ATP-independent periplasmic transporter, DctQ component [Antarctobacter heliothermus]|tara:strand:+ start:2047 stop:2523 length:477 start_codon:yes stop_codon:yes gene_type:complete
MITTAIRRLGDGLSYVYAVIAVLTFGEVCARYFFNAPSQWTIEVVVMLASVHYLMAGPQAYATQTHIRITVLSEKLPLRIQWLLSLFERAVVAVVCAMIGYWALHQAMKAVSITERTGSNLNTPSPTILKVVLVIAIGLFTLQAIVHFIKDLRSRNGS